MSGNVPHMSPDDFRALGKRMVDFIADYWESVEKLPPLSKAKPGDVIAAIPSSPPDHGLGHGAAPMEAWDRVFDDVSSTILPALTHWQSPNFFAFFPANASFPAILGEMLSAGLGVQGMLWATSPACTELEMRVLDWLAQMLGLPDSFRFPRFLASAQGGGGIAAGMSGGSVIQGTASEATLTALVAARTRALAGASGSPTHLVAYASTQAHSSFLKACMIAGLANSPEDLTHVRLIETDDGLRMRPDVLSRAMRADIAAGRAPFFVMATLGTTSSGAADPIPEIAHAIDAACHARRPWLHVDAAYAGSACICPEFRPWLAGVEHADSLCLNPHKWLLTNFDCDCFFTRDGEGVVDAMSVTPEYLRNAASQSGQVVDYRDWHVPLGRRFRALKLWFVIRHYGVAGLQAHIREHVRLGGLFEALVAGDDRFELAAPRQLSLVCFRLRPAPDETPDQTDARNRALLDRINASGRAYLTHTVLPAAGSGRAQRFVLRMAIGATLTREEHVRSAWELICREAGRAGRG